MSDSNDHLVKIVSTVAVTVIVAGIGVVVYLRKTNFQLMEQDRMIHEIEKLRLEVEQLRAEVLASARNGTLSARRTSPQKTRLRSVTFDTDEVILPSVSSLPPLIPRVTSYSSLTSDGEYADAEEEWDNGTITIPCLDDPSRPSVTIPVLSFDDVDKLYGTDDLQKGYNSLKKRYDGGEKANAELLWRLAKFCHEMGGRSDKNRRKELVFEGKKYAEEALAVNDKLFLAVKWAAVMTGQATDYMGTKEKIEQGGKFKEYLDKALAMDPKEYSLLHMRGRYAYSVAGLSWIERKAAAVLFATPPTATYDEALTDFLAAYQQKADWIENLVYLGRCYIQKSDKPNAKKYFSLALKLEAADDAEKELLQEATKSIAKC